MDMQMGRVARRMLMTVCGGLTAAMSLATAVYDADIKILKANGSPSIIVQYTGAKAASVEFRLNGNTIGSRNLNAAKSSGEVAFSVSLDKLQLGDNILEAELLDAAGKPLGSERTVITTQAGDSLPVIIRLPKGGDTLRGTVEIRVGLNVDMRDMFVSFFVDKELKAMKNFPPYSYWWDTTTAANGWHEVEAWTFDQTQTTRKSAPVRVFVNNPGGRTDRLGEGVTTGPKVQPVVGAGAPLRGPGARSEMTALNVVSPGTAPAMGTPELKPPLGAISRIKLGDNKTAAIAGHRVSTPVLEKRKVAAMTTTAKALAASIKGAAAVRYGTRLPKDGPYSVFLNERKVAFDVQPRIQSGVPLTPFRHLFEQAGGKVDWSNVDKVCLASGLGSELSIKIGDLFANVNGKPLQLELAPFLQNGRTIVPLSFLTDALPLDIQYDAATGHVLITLKAEKR